MRNAFQQLIIGVVFIWLDVYVVIDFIPDSIGYLLIYKGIQRLHSNHIAGKLALWLLLLSLPSFFIKLSSLEAGLLWNYYANFLLLLHIIFIYYLFELLRKLSESFIADGLVTSTDRMYKHYMIVNLSVLLIQPFLMNVSTNLSSTIGVICVVAVNLMEIEFLFYLRKMKKQFQTNRIIQKP